ncbi:MAG: hypothetical protein O7H41_20145 [Planctomycetota bacterium]|nr:hypothetical protein [Planctomycetota bacterium]
MRLVLSRILIFFGLTVALAMSVASCGGGSSSSKKGQSNATLDFSAASYTVNESGVSVTISVTRTDRMSNAIFVDFATSDSTAVAGADYTATSGTLTWAASDSTDKNFTVIVMDDNFMEGDEMVTLTLSNPSTGAVIGAQATAVLTILDDDTPPAGALQFSGPTFAFNEGIGTATIDVTRTGGSTGAISVDFATTDDTATSPADFTATSGTLSWADGDSTSQTFTVDISDDTLAESDEAFDLDLSNPIGGAVLGTQSSAVVTIADNDSFGDLEFSTSSYFVSAFAPTIDITVTRSGGSVGMVTVNYSATGNTAQSGSDFTAPPGMLTWNDGDTTDKTIAIGIVDDVLFEGNETIDLLLTNPTGGANLGAFDTAVLTIEEGWVKFPSNPVIVPSSPTNWDDDYVEDPSVLGPASGVSQYEMWFIGVDQATGTEQIGFANSSDGASWSKFGTPVLSPGNPGEWDEAGVSGPHVIYDSLSGTYTMYYNGEDFFGALAIGLATSTDGSNWTKSPFNPVLTVGPSGGWDAGAVAYASVLLDGSTFKMWYTAVNVFGPTGLVQAGYATSSDGLNWTKYSGNPILRPTAGSFDAVGVGFPSVVQDGPSTYRMLYTGALSVGGGLVPPMIGYAFSTNGTSWSKLQDGAGMPVPIFDLGAPGSWDDQAHFGTAWFSSSPAQIWYAAEGGFGQGGIGYATHP